MMAEEVQEILTPPQELSKDYPLSRTSKKTVLKCRDEIKKILKGRDDRMIVIVGPSTIHDVLATLEYGQKLVELAQKLKEDLLIVMRVSFNNSDVKQQWKGFICDPEINGSFQINAGLRKARDLLCNLTDLGLPLGLEIIDTMTPQYFGDLLSWGSIGANDGESENYLELASGSSYPVGFKNDVDGDVTCAVQSMKDAVDPQKFVGINKRGLASMAKSTGNPLCHVVLSGGKKGPNFEQTKILALKDILRKDGLDRRIMVECSNANSNYIYTNQIRVVHHIADEITKGEEGVTGIILESFLSEGSQKATSLSEHEHLKHGISITDGCLSWSQTAASLEGLADAVKKRRERRLGYIIRVKYD